MLQELWTEALAIVSDTETIGRLNGVAAVVQKFDFLFGTMLGELVFKHSDNLSKTLQKETLSAAEGQECAALIVMTLQSLRSPEMFEIFWKKVNTTSKNQWNILVCLGEEKLQNDLTLVQQKLNFTRHWKIISGFITLKLWTW